MTTEENKIDVETATVEFERFADLMDIDIDESAMDEDDLNGFNKQKRKIVVAIQRGDLVINDSGEAVYTPTHPRTKHKDALTFHERSGASLMAMDGKKKNYNVAKTYAILADMCGVHPSVFANMVGKDVKICEALFALLMD